MIIFYLSSLPFSLAFLTQRVQNGLSKSRRVRRVLRQMELLDFYNLGMFS